MLSLRGLNIAKQFLRQCTLTTAAPSKEAETAELNIEENKTSSGEDHLDPKDRSRVISVEKSIRYLKSSAYFNAYGDELVWKLYRRNFKGRYAPKTRKTCIRQNRISTGSPCPICRDEYLVVDYRNVELLKQFISPYNNFVLPSKQTGVCQKQFQKLLVAIKQAENYGLLTYELPHRSYNYDLYAKD